MPATLGTNAGIKQNDTDGGYFMPLSSLVGVIYAYTPGSGAGGSFAQGTFSTDSWAAPAIIGAASLPAAALGGGKYLSSINGAGAGLLKDMGKTVVSAGRTFRKIQLVARNVSTSGVEGNAPATTPVQDFLTGFIELGFDGAGLPAPVAKYGR